MEPVMIGISLEFLNLTFVIAFLTWVLQNVWRQRRDGDINEKHGPVRGSRVFTMITVISNVIISTLYLGFGLYEYWNHRIITIKSVFLFMNWVLATLVAVLSKNRILSGDKRWPLILILWWVFSFIIDSVSLSIYTIRHLKSIDFPSPLPEPNIVDFVSFPLAILLCFNAFPTSCTRKHSDVVEPLLQKENETFHGDDGAFTNAGIWSQLTFQWLNPIFKRGRVQKLELPYVPSIPQSETAENASLLLEESLRKQKFEASLLPKAIAYSIWKSLVMNATFADNGVTNSTTMVFCAQRIGIQLRAALMVLIYKKSLYTRHVGLSNGKIINLINVDAERIGDFCWYIHGVWLLPVQVILALIILYRNLGAAPSIAALFATVLVMVCNTPLANMQERLHSKIMEAKDSRIKVTSETLKSMRIMKGYKVAVCGPVGSGKSSLLSSILGEIPRISGGGITVYGRKAYVPQTAWIQTGSIRDNVLFGKEMNKAYYEDVLEACALNQDIKIWQDRDLSVVGERGMNLSGGQKQRIQLARAVYSDADKCLMQLLSQKTVIYATHQVEFLDDADLVLVMKAGKIVQSGKYEDLIVDPNGELVRQMAAHIKSLDQVNPLQDDNTLTSRPCKINQIEVTEENFEAPINNGKLTARTQEEETETGRVKWSVYSTFVTSAYKGTLVPVILLCQVLFQGLQMGSNYWIAWATEVEAKSIESI
ncbi:abc transporter c family member 7 [Quercus suber]|uniref:ABC-type xenobiotic transporter n=1 Tax=Quercus suber TaxID=58331 RepID=A0AAW0J795_QUESU